MRHALFKHILLSGVSFGAVDITLAAALKRGPAPLHIRSAHGFLARVGVWLLLIFGGGSGREVATHHVIYIAPTSPNRHKARLRRRKLPMPRRPDLLAQHFLRRYGRLRYLEWIYNRTLAPRIAWCFRDWNWRWAPRESFVACAGDAQLTMDCAAPIWPD